MKLLYIKLVNYIGIFIGTGRHEVEVDFTKSTSPLTLLIGPNGSGKTTLISTFHPLAEVIDDDKKSIILDGVDGEKIVHFIDDNGNIFYIRHYYKAENGTHSIKSYIDKFDVLTGIITPLNPNGNRSSFHTVVFEELGVDSSYLKLSSMGVNMTSFIKLKAAERKRFMSNILSETDIYLQYYKKVSIKSRDSKAIINSLTSKISRLPDKNSLDIAMFSAEQRLSELRALKESILDKLSSLKTQIELVDPDSRLLNEYNDLKTQWEESGQLYSKMKSPYRLSDEQLLIHFTELENGILGELENNQSKISARISELNLSIQSNNIRLEELRGRLKEKQTSASSFKSDVLLSDLLMIEGILKEELSAVSSEYMIDISENELKGLISTLEKVENIVSSIYSEFASDMIVEGVGYVNKNVNLSSYQSHHKSLVAKRDGIISQFSQTSARIEMLTKTVSSSDNTNQIPLGCTNPDCPYIPANQKKQVDLEISKLIEFRDSLEKELGLLDNQIDLLAGATKVAELIFTAYSLVEANENVVMKLNKNDTSIYYPISNFCNNIVVRKSFSGIMSLQHVFEAVENTKRFVKLTTIDIPKIESDIAIARNNEAVLIEINRDIDTISDDISSLEDIVAQMKRDMVDGENVLKQIMEDVAFYSSMQLLKDAGDRFKILDVEKTKLESSLSNILHMQDNMETLNVQVQDVIRSIHDGQEELKKIEFQQNTYLTYHSELDEVQSKYVYIEHVKTALSSSEGIPLEFIDDYLEETKGIANELLQYAFDGELKIIKFHIDDDDFNIRCDYQGQVINDVTLLSGGQKAIISLVFSVALIRQMSSIYNVFLLDEVDGVLDEKNRAAFLFMLENIIKALNVQSVNVISHNNAFESYDVNLILFGQEFQFPGKNILTII